jgi:type II site-specific deoxyribonuclease
MGLNKGEWSELYAMLYLIVNRKLLTVDSNLKIISDDLFKVKTIINPEQKGDLIIDFSCDGKNIIPTVYGALKEPISIKEVQEIKEQLFSSINSNKGAFTIEEIPIWFNSKGINATFKAPTNQKQDIILINYDLFKNKITPKLGYSIKSQLGSPATILNASAQTDFRYIVENLSQDKIAEINNIKTDQKLRDRITRIKELGGKISFDSVVSQTFNNNLSFIDTNFGSALAEALLNSYELKTKSLKELFSNSRIYEDKNLAYHKLKDFLYAISFGMLPSIKWNGEYSANGGFIIVSKDSNVYILDNIYYEKEVRKYLLEETKLESPSATRYHMLELKENEQTGKIYFTLNLQIRFKK